MAANELIGIFNRARNAQEEERRRYKMALADQARQAKINADPSITAGTKAIVSALGGDPNKPSTPDPTSHKMTWDEYRKFKMTSEGVDVGPDPSKTSKFAPGQGGHMTPQTYKNWKENVQGKPGVNALIDDLKRYNPPPEGGRNPASAFGSLEDTWEESLKKTLTEPGRYQKEIKETVMPPDYNWPGDNVYPGRTPDEIDLLEQEQIKKWGSPDRGPEPMPERHLASDDLQMAPDYPMLKAQGQANSAQADVFKKMMGGNKDWKREVPYGPGADPMGQSNDWDSRIQMNQFRNAAAEDEITNLRQVGRGMGANMGNRSPQSFEDPYFKDLEAKQHAAYIQRMKDQGATPEQIQAYIQSKQMTPGAIRRNALIKGNPRSRLKSKR